MNLILEPYSKFKKFVSFLEQILNLLSKALIQPCWAREEQNA